MAINAVTVKFSASPSQLLTKLSDSASMRCDVTTDQGGNDTQLSRVSAIVVSKGDGAPVASVTEFDPPMALLAAGDLEVKGSVSGPGAFLQLAWGRPQMVALGGYRCTVTGVDTDGQKTNMTSSLNLTSVQPTIDDVIDVFNRKFRQQHETITKQQQDMDRLTDDNTQQQIVISNQQNEIMQLSQHASQQQPNSNSNDSDIAPNQQTDIVQLLEESNQQNLMISNLSSSVSKLEACFDVFVSFHASISYERFTGDRLAVARGQTVVYDDVTLNLGGGYNGSSGVFICQTPGVYEFVVHAQGEPISPVALQLTVNGQETVDLYKDNSGSFADASLSHMAHLAPGDVVNVAATWPSTLHGEAPRFHAHSVNYFTGKLVHATDCLA